MSDFNKHVGKTITKERAAKLKENWKKTKIKTQSSFFGVASVLDLLNKPGVIGLKINYGLDEHGNMAPVLTAELEASTDEKEEPGLLNASLPCPPYCT